MEERAVPDADSALLARMAAGDEAALSILMTRHRQRLRNLALRMTGRSDEADDIVQEAFVAIWRHGTRFRSEGVPFAAYLTRIVVNRSIDRIRRARLRRFIGMDEATEAVDELPDADRTSIGQSEIAAVAKDIGRLPARQRAAILLVSTGERSTKDVADILGLSVGAVEQLLVRARRSLRIAALKRMTDIEDLP